MNSFQKIAVITLSGASLLASWKLSGQIRDQNAPQQQMSLQGMSPQELQLMRHDLRKQKQKLIAENLPMTESEAIKFWAVYQKYSDELKQINDEKYAMIHSYASCSPAELASVSMVSMIANGIAMAITRSASTVTIVSRRSVKVLDLRARTALPPFG